MVELLHAYNEEGGFVKTQERKGLLKDIRDYSYAHGNANLAVPVFHLMLTNPKEQLYVVQRADKPENPFLYDKTAGGHVRAGESYVSCLLREANQEIAVHVVVADVLDYRDVVRATDLTKHAVVRAIDFDNWSKSIRTVKDGKPWAKRDRVVTYAGMYDGKLKHKDGEAMGCIMLKPEELKEEIKKRPNEFTYDLEVLLQEFHHFLKPVS